ncbi:hypothetical protein SI65_09194 [Aspergillus cristatus]|uniref:Uncharacterized protein n=1 Tax=Aspergillus cristatus TaxID=573508 RepID=A0A1E3B2T3_ASPCR|nr:hypothetical protein SI65_09194 [Aspergillus cristatus]
MDEIREQVKLDGHNHSLFASSPSLRRSSLHEYPCGKWQYYAFGYLEPGILTNTLLAAEFNYYAAQRKPLRVLA